MTAHSYRETILSIAKRHGVNNVRLFGSFARGDQRPESDIDLLVRFNDSASIIDAIDFKLDLEEALRRKVDVVDEGGLSNYLRDRIMHEAQPL